MQCRSCGKEIVFAVNPQTLNKIPLQKVTTYEINWKGPNNEENVAVKVERDIYISHFLTCSGANNHGRGNQKKENQASFL